MNQELEEIDCANEYDDQYDDVGLDMLDNMFKEIYFQSPHIKSIRNTPKGTLNIYQGIDYINDHIKYFGNIFFGITQSRFKSKKVSI